MVMAALRFRYRAIGADGARIKGDMEAANVADLEMRLRRMGLALVRAQPATTIRPRLWRRAVRRDDLIGFCFHLEQLLRAGVPLLESLTDFRDCTEHPVLRQAMAAVIDDIQGGQTFSMALASHQHIFDEVFVNLVAAGEASGELPDLMLRLTDMLKWRDSISSQTRLLMLYPALTAVVVMVALGVLMTKVVPELIGFLQSVRLAVPWYTRLLIATSEVAVQGAMVIGPMIVATALLLPALRRQRPTLRLVLDGWALRSWGIGPLLRKMALASFSHTLAMLSTSGLPLIDGLRIAEGTVRNARLRDGLQRARVLIVDGAGVSRAFADVGLFPPLVIRMLRVGEHTGNMDRALQSVGFFYDRDVRMSVSRLQTLLQPVMTLVLGLLLGWCMFAVLGVIYQSLDQIKL